MSLRDRNFTNGFQIVFFNLYRFEQFLAAGDGVTITVANKEPRRGACAPFRSVWIFDNKRVFP